MIDLKNFFEENPKILPYLIIILLPLPFKILDYIFKKTTFYKKFYKATRKIDRILKCIYAIFFFIVLPIILRWKLILSEDEKEIAFSGTLCYFYLFALIITSIIIMPGYFSYLKDMSNKELETIEKL